MINRSLGPSAVNSRRSGFDIQRFNGTPILSGVGRAGNCRLDTALTSFNDEESRDVTGIDESK